MTSPNGTGYILPTAAQGLANYTHARTVPSSSRTIYVSGISSRRPDGTFEGCTTNPADGTFALDCAEQTAAVLRNIEAVIRGATGGRRGLESVVDATVFLVNIPDHYGQMNGEWNKVWPDREKAPARTCVQVGALPHPKILVEIKCTAVVDE